MEFIDLKAQYQALKNEIDAAISEVLRHGQFILGKEVSLLEQEMSDSLGVKHVVTCGNGTDALMLLYMAYGFQAGDAVFFPDLTFFATVEPAMLLGATPVFCDVKKDNYNMCPENLERQIKAVLREGRLKPRAVVPVDFLGNPADYNEIAEICKKYGLTMIEDAAQSFGSLYNGKKCGSLGDAAITSFFPAKPLGCYGDGGAVMTNDDNLAELLKSLRFHGKGDSKYDNIRVGLNSRLDTIQAAILRVKLRALREYELDVRQIVASRYNDSLKDRFRVLKVRDGSLSVYAQYAFLAEDKEQRDKISLKLKENNIPSMIYYPKAQHQLPVMQGIGSYGEHYINSEYYCDRTLSLPMHPYLGLDEQNKIIECVAGV